MTMIVEDGTVIANANSYLSVAAADTYFTEHGSPTDWSDLTTGDKESALKYATKWLDNNYKWYSCIISTSQVLDWPRKAFTDSEGRSIGGSGIMPQDLLDATAEMALEQTKSSLVESSANVRRERIGSSEVEYTGSGSSRSYAFITLGISELGRPRKSGIRIRKGG